MIEELINIVRVFISKWNDVFVKRRELRTNSLLFSQNEIFSTSGFAGGKIKSLAFQNIGTTDCVIYNAKPLAAVAAPGVPEIFIVSAYDNNFYINDNIQIAFTGGTGQLLVLIMSEL